MKMTMKSKGIIIGISAVLCLVGFYGRDAFLSFSVSEVLNETFTIKSGWSLPHQTFGAVLFVIALGIIPLLFLLVKRIRYLNSLPKQLLSIAIIVASGFVFWLGRLFYLKFKAAQINDLLRRAEFATAEDVPRLKFEEMHFELYLFLGLVAGMLLSLLVFRRKIRN